MQDTLPRLLIALLLAAALPALAVDTQALAWAQAHDLVRDAGVAGGICCVAQCADPEFPVALARQSKWIVHVLEADEARAEALRDRARALGLRPPGFVVEHWTEDRLPYVENLVDLVIAPDTPPDYWTNARQAEVLRALRPGGKLYKRATNATAPWDVAMKPPTAGVDDWSHWEHGPDNNPVSTDTVIRAPYMTQWLGLPYYIAMPAVTTAAGGRIFLAMGHIAHHEREEPWLNTLLARNGYNGEELWRRRLPDGYLVHRSAFVATDDTFYMIDLDGSGCLLLDPETGAEKGRIRLPELAGEWKWIALQDGVLYILEGKTHDPGQTTVVRSEQPAWSWGELSTGYYDERIPWGFGNAIAAYDLAAQRLNWVRWEDAPIDARGMAIGDGKVFFYEPDARLGALAAQSGDVLWTNEDPGVRALIEEEARGLFSTPGFRTACICVYTPKGLFYQGQAQANLVAISKDDGRMLWSRPKTSNNPNVIYLDGFVLAGLGEEGTTLAFDPITGEVLDSLGFKKRSCVRLTATPDSLFVRGYPEGLTRYDRATKQIQFDGSVRPGCNDGAIGANGLLYLGPWLCDCNLSLMGAVALSSAGNFDPAAVQGERVYYSEDAEVAAQVPADDLDWDAYRAGTAHNGATAASVSPALLPLWVWKEGVDHEQSLDDRETFKPTAPTAAAGYVFVGGGDGGVRALDAATGELRWRFETAGAIMQPPAYWKGRVFAGSGDGCVYALEAATGRLLWKFRAAPVERRTMVYGALGSVWPVNTGVVVQDGVAFFAAGIIDFDGTYVYAVDAATGALKWANTATGHLDKDLRKGVSAQGNITIMDGKLWLAAGNVMPPAPYDLETGVYLGEDNVGDGSPRVNRGEEIGVLGDRFLVCGGRLRYSAAENVVNPGRFSISDSEEQKLEFALGRVMPAWDGAQMVCVPTRQSAPAAYDGAALLAELGKKRSRLPKRAWEADHLEGSRTEALALADKTVVVACVTPRERSLEPQYRICLLSRESGDLVWESDLHAAPCLNGAAIDRDGRVLVSMMDGSVAAWGGADALQSYLAGLAAMAQSGAAGLEHVVERLRSGLGAVHDYEGQAMLLTKLRDLGVDVLGDLREKGVVTGWHLLGPVPWDEDRYPLDWEFVGEPRVRTDRSVRVAREKLEWRKYATVDTGGMVSLRVMYGAHEYKAAYAFAEVILPEDGDYLLGVGSNDGFKCWFNGAEAGRFEGGRAYSPNKDNLPVHGKKGKNEILLKVTQLGGDWAFSVQIFDANGQPVPLGITEK